jgi:hypothetical protein
MSHYLAIWKNLEELRSQFPCVLAWDMLVLKTRRVLVLLVVRLLFLEMKKWELTRRRP